MLVNRILTISVCLMLKSMETILNPSPSEATIFCYVHAFVAIKFPAERLAVHAEVHVICCNTE